MQTITNTPVAEIRLSRRSIIELVAAEKLNRGETSLSTVAEQLIRERMTQLEERRSSSSGQTPNTANAKG